MSNDKANASGAPAARTTLVIDRSKWLRGEGSGGSYLLRERDGKMCCLGFFGLACGVPGSRMTGAGRPDEGSVVDSGWPEWLVNHDLQSCTEAATCLMGANDNAALSGVEREQKVTAIFAKHGVEVRFVDGAGT